jgi:type 1 glutamine amidotransferase
MNRNMRILTGVQMLLASLFGGLISKADPPGEDVLAKIREAAPAQAYAKPQKPRKLLLFTLTREFHHDSIPVGIAAMKILGERTGAFEVVHSEDPAIFEPDSLRQFDAICMLNTTGELFEETRRKQAFLDFVSSGKGLVGIHAATDCFYRWPEYGQMIGGYFDGHPWHEDVVIKNEDPGHPLNGMFDGQPLEITDEIYQFKDPYARERLHVLLSLDTTRTNMKKDGINRKDGDFPISWLRNQGKGRIFYCSLGHRDEIYWNPKVLRHYLAGIQFALGDLPAKISSAQSPDSDWTPLFDGKDLTGWKGWVGDPKKRAEMTPEQRAEAQKSADERMRDHWKVAEGVLVFDGAGDSLCTAKDYGDFELKVDWKIELDGDSGIYLRGCPQVQIWDAGKNPEGSGGLYNNRHQPSKPLVRADKPIGQWNSFRIKMIGDLVWVSLNDRPVVDGAALDNCVDPSKPIWATGQIELQAHKTPLFFRSIAIRPILATEVAAVRNAPRWRELFSGRDFEGWQLKPESWVVEDGALARKGGGDIWTKEQFGDFVLDVEFKLDKETNSGIFFRTSDLNDSVQTGIELQVLDSYGKDQPDKHDCGAIYDCLAPSKNTVRQPGEWNHVVLTCKGSKIYAMMNGEPIIDMDLDRWTEPGKNPDGTPNKFKTAYKDMPRRGYIGFQDHGKPVWYRNIYIKSLDAETLRR